MSASAVVPHSWLRTTTRDPRDTRATPTPAGRTTLTLSVWRSSGGGGFSILARRVVKSHSRPPLLVGGECSCVVCFAPPPPPRPAVGRFAPPVARHSRIALLVIARTKEHEGAHTRAPTSSSRGSPPARGRRTSRSRARSASSPARSGRRPTCRRGAPRTARACAAGRARRAGSVSR